MTTTHDRKSEGEKAVSQRAAPRAHEWEQIAGFSLSLEARAPQNACILEPVARALEPLGLPDFLQCEISMAIEDAGEDLRGCCQEGKLDCVAVRVHAATQALRGNKPAGHEWSYYLIKQMASSESDDLDGVQEPRCFIDLHVFPAA